MILACLNSDSELLIKLVESKLRKWAEILVTLGKLSASLERVQWEILGDQ